MIHSECGWLMSRIVKLVGSVVIVGLCYVSLLPTAYALSSYLLMKGIILRHGLLRDFQRDFYVNGGFRRIWQLETDCVQPDERLIYVPRIGRCRFTNPEFDTWLTFDTTGRVMHDRPSNRLPHAIAVLGDSFAMGWGVNDEETFASVLQSESNRPVYNLAVSSYGTVRELMRLEQSHIGDRIDTILIQYAGNDLMENKALDDTEKQRVARTTYNTTLLAGTQGTPRSVRKSISRAFAFSLEKPIRNLRDWAFPQRTDSFSPHYGALMSVLESFSSLLAGKRVVVFYLDEERFADFPSGNDTRMDMVEFIDIPLRPEHFYAIDGHLNPEGHAEVGRILSRHLAGLRDA